MNILQHLFFSNTTALGISENYAEFSHINTENECFQVLKRQSVTQYDYNRTGRMQQCAREITNECCDIKKPTSD